MQRFDYHFCLNRALPPVWVSILIAKLRAQNIKNFRCPAVSDDDKKKAISNLGFSAIFMSSLSSFILRLKITSLRKLCKGYK